MPSYRDWAGIGTGEYIGLSEDLSNYFLQFLDKAGLFLLAEALRSLRVLDVLATRLEACVVEVLSSTSPNFYSEMKSIPNARGSVAISGSKIVQAMLPENYKNNRSWTQNFNKGNTDVYTTSKFANPTQRVIINQGYVLTRTGFARYM